jgi:hypothetical protein
MSVYLIISKMSICNGCVRLVTRRMTSQVRRWNACCNHKPVDGQDLDLDRNRILLKQALWLSEEPNMNDRDIDLMYRMVEEVDEPLGNIKFENKFENRKYIM